MPVDEMRKSRAVAPSKRFVSAPGVVATEGALEGAIEQLHAELVLECLDLPGERGLGNVQPFGGTRQVLFLGHGHVGPEVRVLPDKWTVVTSDGSRSAQFEHTLLVTESGCEILTKLSE